MAIDLVNTEEVRTDYEGKTKHEIYDKYFVAIEKHMSWIKDQIESSKDGVIRIKTTDMGSEMGGEFAKKNPTSLYWGLKYVLFNEGIVVDTGTHKSGDKLLIMRLGTENDVLPLALDYYTFSVRDEYERKYEDEDDAVLPIDTDNEVCVSIDEMKAYEIDEKIIEEAMLDISENTQDREHDEMLIKYIECSIENKISKIAVKYLEELGLKYDLETDCYTGKIMAFKYGNIDIERDIGLKLRYPQVWICSYGSELNSG